MKSGRLLKAADIIFTLMYQGDGRIGDQPHFIAYSDPSPGGDDARLNFHRAKGEQK